MAESFHEVGIGLDGKWADWPSNADASGQRSTVSTNAVSHHVEKNVVVSEHDVVATRDGKRTVARIG